MSKLNDPPPDPARTSGKRRQPIIRNRKRRPLHPETIRDLIYARSQEDHVERIHEGFQLVFYEPDGVKHYIDVIYVKLSDGTRRPATYADAVAIRDAEMAEFGYEKCWIYTRDEVNARFLR